MRVAIITGFLTISVVAYRRLTASDNVLITIGQGALYVFAAVSAAVLLSLLGRAAGSGYERDRLWRRAQDEGKHLVLMEGEWSILSDEELEAIKHRKSLDTRDDEAPPHGATGQLRVGGITSQTNQPGPDGRTTRASPSQ